MKLIYYKTCCGSLISKQNIMPLGHATLLSRFSPGLIRQTREMRYYVIPDLGPCLGVQNSINGTDIYCSKASMSS